LEQKNSTNLYWKPIELFNVYYAFMHQKMVYLATRIKCKTIENSNCISTHVKYSGDINKIIKQKNKLIK
jgi:hypothetical protein